MYKLFGKRVFDIIAVIVCGIPLLVLILPIVIWIKFSSKGSLFYIQKRVGKDFKEFNMYKFRSMKVNSDKQGPSVTSADDTRITKIGKFLRKTKIDELPQLFNVLKGDMSLVGPRPEVMKFVIEKRVEYKKILTIKPGITDNAAIIYRDEEMILQRYDNKEEAYINEILPHKIKLYFNYIDNISFFGDIKLILKTIKVI